MAGRRLSTETIRKAMDLPRSTYYSQLEKGTLITADKLRKAATNLGINRAELLTRYRLIDPGEVRSLAKEIGGPARFCMIASMRLSAGNHEEADVALTIATLGTVAA